MPDDSSETSPNGPPQAPSALPKYLREGAQKQSADTLRLLADYATLLADYKETQAERELAARADHEATEPPEEWSDRADEWEAVLETAREKADLGSGTGTLTTKHIDGRDYYYLQWRDDETIRSQYVAPVTPASNT